MENKKLLSVTDLQSYLGLKRSYIYKLVFLGKLPAYKPFGKKLLFDKEKIDLIIQSKEKISNQGLEIIANNYSLNKK